MRVSWRSSDKDFVGTLDTGKVFLDGERIQEVFAIDVDAGFIDAYQRGENGELVVGGIPPDILTYRKHGKVVFVGDHDGTEEPI